VEHSHLVIGIKKFPWVTASEHRAGAALATRYMKDISLLSMRALLSIWIGQQESYHRAKALGCRMGRWDETLFSCSGSMSFSVASDSLFRELHILVEAQIMSPLMLTYCAENSLGQGGSAMGKNLV